MSYLLKLKSDHQKILDEAKEEFTKENEVKVVKYPLMVDVDGAKSEQYYFGIKIKNTGKVYLQDHLNFYLYFECDIKDELDLAVIDEADLSYVQSKIAVVQSVELEDRALVRYTGEHRLLQSRIIMNNALIENKVSFPVNVAQENWVMPDPYNISQLKDMSSTLVLQDRIIVTLDLIKSSLLEHLPLNEVKSVKDIDLLANALDALLYIEKDGFILKRDFDNKGSLEVIGSQGQSVSKVVFSDIGEGNLSELEEKLNENENISCIFFEFQEFSSEGFVPEALVDLFRELSKKKAILVTEDDDSKVADSSYIKYLEAIELEKGNIAFISGDTAAINGYLASQSPERYQEVVNIAKHSKRFNNEVESALDNELELS